jgi:hypothetical protein
MLNYQPRAYTLHGAPLAFSKATLLRGAAQGRIILIHVGGKTLIGADEIERILSGKADLPEHPARRKPPQPKRRPPGRPRKPQQPAGAE